MPSRDKYTDPDLRDEVKEEIHASDKGGRPGQWSARKAQLMASEYKKRGGSYTTDKETGQDESQKHLSKWTEEEWQTKEGDANATKEDDGTKKRYLPKKAWENMSEKEKEETEKKKEEGGKEGKQYVGNTGKAKEERRKASKDTEGEGDEEEDEEEESGQESKGKKNGTSTAAKKGQKPGRPSKSKDTERKEKEGEQEGEDEDGDHAEEDGVDNDGEEEEDGDFVEDTEANQADEEEDEDDGDGNEDEPHGQKRVHTRQDDKIENKKQKTNGEENGEKE
ncbi:uncharacterized protein BHQ10_006391 [Talaromyces amestolkiae]|uniref:Hypervirulence associated protein TUDOR domain-containing protein n=1 Tax=Talaromyces amestolkiae TaxID=1196081 RepID=A0A364L3J0_TALAM|nr:uncharacterized protein BHQ10_006391 [Talaromyces amestolkiae]RAO70379.1 hypothetical protein BHQ10_006391 [Talaromyces amestolkiae]